MIVYGIFIDHSYIVKKVQVCMLPMQGQGYSQALVGILCCMVVRAHPQQREALYGDVYGGL